MTGGQTSSTTAPPDPEAPLLDVRHLSTVFHTYEGEVNAVRDVSFTVMPGETLGVVGESGSGKSITGLSVMRLVPEPPGEIVSGEVLYQGRDLLRLRQNEMRHVRGKEIAMIFQDPMTSLNPVLTINRQIGEAIRRHLGLGRHEARERVIELLDLVGIPSARERVDQYPHQFSGGMRQRVVIAMALSCDPRLVIADEPTTALDVTIQAQILDLLRRLQRERGMGMVMITHSMGVVAGIADRVQVMYAGGIVETAPTMEMFAAPKHPYTLGLMRSIPPADSSARAPLHPIRGLPPDPIGLQEMCAFAPRCDFARDKCFTARPSLEDAGPDHRVACWFWREIESGTVEPIPVAATPGSPQPTAGLREQEEPLLQVRDLFKHFGVPRSILKGRPAGAVRAVDGVSFEVRRGETLGLVGESGCGKSTMGRAILQLHKPTAGEVLLEGTDLTTLSGADMRAKRRGVQMIFQDPFASLNPKMTIERAVSEPMLIHELYPRREWPERTAHLLEKVGLSPTVAKRYPHEFSGGQRQRIGIARALAAEPALVVCDEPVSALDVSIQAQIVNLLEKLQNEIGLTYLFIAHDLSVVRHISHRVAVMYLGRIVEIAECDELFRNPMHPYTQALLSAVPVADPVREAKRERILLSGDIPNPANPPSGCHFRTRCPYAMKICETADPVLQAMGHDHAVACHLHGNVTSIDRDGAPGATARSRTV